MIVKLQQAILPKWLLPDVERVPFLGVAIMLLTVFLAGCGSSYSFDRSKKEAEAVLHAGKVTQARKLYARIFRSEKNASPLVKDHLLWAFYRLGVIHEVLDKRALAKGYYWGDQFDKGYYADSPRVAWLAQTGWEWLDSGIPPRSLKKIFELEAADYPPKIASAPKVASPTRPVPGTPTTTHRNGQPLRSYDRSLNRPPSEVAQPFKVFF